MLTLPLYEPPLLQDDIYTLALLQGLLFVGWAVAVTCQANLTRRRNSSNLKVTVTRSEESMAALLTMYGVATVAVSLAVQVADAAEGYKVSIIAIDYFILTHLFFFCTWFRNKLFGLVESAKREDY